MAVKRRGDYDAVHRSLDSMQPATSRRFQAAIPAKRDGPTFRKSPYRYHNRSSLIPDLESCSPEKSWRPSPYLRAASSPRLASARLGRSSSAFLIGVGGLRLASLTTEAPDR